MHALIVLSLCAGGRGPSSVGGVFRTQLGELVGGINATGNHFVRCIKPNQSASPDPVG